MSQRTSTTSAAPFDSGLLFHYLHCFLQGSISICALLGRVLQDQRLARTPFHPVSVMFLWLSTRPSPEESPLTMAILLFP